MQLYIRYTLGTQWHRSLSGAATVRNLQLVLSNRDKRGAGGQESNLKGKKEQIQNRRVECVIVVQMSLIERVCIS